MEVVNIETEETATYQIEDSNSNIRVYNQRQSSPNALSVDHISPNDYWIYDFDVIEEVGL